MAGGGASPGREPSLAASLRSGTTISSFSQGGHSGYEFRTVGTGRRLLVGEAFLQAGDPSLVGALRESLCPSET